VEEVIELGDHILLLEVIVDDHVPLVQVLVAFFIDVLDDRSVHALFVLGEFLL